MFTYKFITTVCVIAATSSCTHITLLGHKSAYDVNAEFSGDPIAPVSLNAGFEGRTFAAVPPREAVKWSENIRSKLFPRKDVMSTLLELKVEKVAENPNNPHKGMAFDFVTSGATGLAADAATGLNAEANANLKDNATGIVQSNEAEEVAAKIQNVTSSGAATFADDF